MSDLYFAWCDGESFPDPSRTALDDGSVRASARRARGWHLLYPATEDGEDDLYIGPYATFAAAYLASLEERP